MITLFGKFCRKLRIDNGELLKDMADNLGVTSSYLSAVENGKREIPSSWEKIIVKKYKLSRENANELGEVIYNSQKQIRIETENLKDKDKDLLVSFARKFESLSNEKKEAIKKLLKE